MADRAKNGHCAVTKSGAYRCPGIHAVRMFLDVEIYTPPYVPMGICYVYLCICYVSMYLYYV